MSYFMFATISAFSIALPCALSLIRCKHIYKRYMPFILILCIGLLNEGLSLSLIRLYNSNLINSNIYTLFEYILYLFFFQRISELKNKSLLILFAIGVSTWFTDNFLLHNLMHSNSVFRVIASLIILWLSINKLSLLTFNVLPDHFKKTDLLLCCSFLAYFTFRGFIHVIKLFSIGYTTAFYIDLWIILSILNLLVNISFFIAILWIPKQQPSTQHF